MTIAIVPRDRNSCKEVSRAVGATTRGHKLVNLIGSSPMQSTLKVNTYRMLESNKGNGKLHHHVLISKL